MGTQTSFSKIVRARFSWLAVLAAVLIFSLVISLVVALTHSTDEENVAAETETPLTSIPTPSESKTETVRLDSDGDGLFDDQEIEGWQTKDGSVHKTDPFSADTDGDGLTDKEEAGQLLTESGTEGLIYQGVSNPLKADSDDDGLDDKAEIEGWLDADGKKCRTNPLEADTDGDGLSDGLEAGKATVRAGSVVYELLSDPTRVDSDNDGLNDAEELNQGTDPFSKDSDGDGLDDGDEVLTIGTDPRALDTDGDGIDDRFELQEIKSRDLDPLVPNIKMTKLQYATDFAVGAIFGDLKQRDSIAWLLGTLTVSGIAMLIPVVKNYLQVLTSVRDLTAASIEEDWVGAAYAVKGVFGYSNEMKNIQKKVKNFVKRNDNLQFEASNAISKIPLLSDGNQEILSKIIWGDTWTALSEKGLSDGEISRLALSRNHLKNIIQMLDGDAIVAKPVVPFRSINSAENFLENEFKLQGYQVDSQVVMDSRRCEGSTNSVARLHDIHVQLEQGKTLAVEVKVGQVLLTDTVKMQLQSDLCLREKGEISAIRWEFVPSSLTGQVGVSPALKNYLSENDVEIVFRGIR
ncbi:hypothetical protein AUO95_11295 [Corynebacterium glutamicum]|nr:hypothetical protein AUO95_11295 [Corynebacterium glutamicum]